MPDPADLNSPAASPTTATQPWLTVEGSPHWLDWLLEQRLTVAFTTYQTGKLFFVGRKQEWALSAFERTFNRCMGLWASPATDMLWLSTKWQLWKFHRIPADTVPVTALRTASEPSAPIIHNWGQLGFDQAYIPRVGYTTGDVDIHDVAVETSGRPIFVCTQFNCLATVSDRANFQPLWQPSFIKSLMSQDCCHLNGLAMRNGRAAFVTAAATTYTVDGWRSHRRHGGVVIDIESGEVVASDLSMPHSPRWYRDRLWLLNSGAGEFGWIDLTTGRFQPITFCPGYLRGLTFHGDYAVVTVSKPRHASYESLELSERIKRDHAEAWCGLAVIDLRSGEIMHTLRLNGTLVTELYDAVVLPGVRQAMAVGFKNDEIEQLTVVDAPGTLAT